MQTRRARLESRENSIVDAARALISAQGYAGTTIAEISKRAGVAEGTVYLYYKNKEALARAVLADFYGRLTQTARTGVARHETTRARLAFLARHHLQSIIRDKEILELISMADRDPESYKGGDLYRMNRDYVAVFDDVFQEGVWRGDIRNDLTLWIMRDMFFGGLEYAMRTVLINQRRNDIDLAVAEAVRLVVRDGAPSVDGPAPSVDGRLANVADRIENAASRLERLARAASS